VILVTLTNPFARGPSLAPQYANDTAVLLQFGDRITAGESCIADVEDPILDSDAANQRYVKNSASQMRTVLATDTQVLSLNTIYAIDPSVGTLYLPTPDDVIADIGYVIQVFMTFAGPVNISWPDGQIGTSLGDADVLALDKQAVATFLWDGGQWQLNFH
jgi:hypothetical protein